MKQIIELNVNGQMYDVIVQPEDLLIDVLRDKLELLGTKKGCGQGDCGTCTVLINGRPHLSCITLAISCQGKEIQTIEGLEKDGEMDPIQKSYVKHGAVQCGFCTPGMIMSTKALLDENPDPSSEDIKKALAGNLCRCTGYKKIEEAVKNVNNVNEVNEVNQGGKE